MCESENLGPAVAGERRADRLQQLTRWFSFTLRQIVWISFGVRFASPLRGKHSITPVAATAPAPATVIAERSAGSIPKMSSDKCRSACPKPETASVRQLEWQLLFFQGNFGNKTAGFSRDSLGHLVVRRFLEYNRFAGMPIRK